MVFSKTVEEHCSRLATVFDQLDHLKAHGLQVSSVSAKGHIFGDMLSVKKALSVTQTRLRQLLIGHDQPMKVCTFCDLASYY